MSCRTCTYLLINYVFAFQIYFPLLSIGAGDLFFSIREVKGKGKKKEGIFFRCNLHNQNLCNKEASVLRTLSLVHFVYKFTSTSRKILLKTLSLVPIGVGTGAAPIILPELIQNVHCSGD